MKNLYILSGPHGAGKTTVARHIMNMYDCKEFVNADEIARGLSPYNYDKVDVQIQAAKIMLSRIDDMLNESNSFMIETTLSTRSYKCLVERAHGLGYNVTLIFLRLNSVELSKLRVKQRVKSGGHDVPEDVIERRFERGCNNLENIFKPIVDKWFVFDTSTLQVEYVASENSRRTDDKDERIGIMRMINVAYTYL